ncbi:tubulin-like doman-containing protein [Actinoallomurus sp. NPDC052308]|uniref:tubulin-like doman-containing protein n=1 Tax=Actinoallomurus sp. NPDC052308 TaxID=3155530 RepID=UPI003412F5F4
MKLYQPVLFVGLGGTGCQIGAELERRFREEICGPDGSLFQHKREDAQRYQLPACLQFVYADVNQAELDRIPPTVVPGAQHIPAAQVTAHYVRDLVPQVDLYPQVAVNLRAAAGPVVQNWLPPAHGEPRVLVRSGAGQMPTVGRAALFETFRSGLRPAVRDLDDAIGALSGNQAATDLYKLAGASGDPQAVDVFVAFSVAGGTGAGIFYDYLHLIAQRFRGLSLKPKIYPLVLMPSAFKEGSGGGRPAELNAGRALLDLFRLVDHQNTADAVRDLPGLDRGPADPDEIAVRYPVDGRITMLPGTAQTAFLFSRPVGAAPDDLRRSVVSLIMSLVGTELGDRRGDDGEQHQSFADNFVNSTGLRQSLADNGIGYRGVSTSLVTSLTTPVEELADVVAGRLLRVGIEELQQPTPGEESNRSLIEEFFTLSQIHRVFARPQLEFAEPEPAVGARDVTAALNDRLDAMRGALSDHKVRLDREVPDMVTAFDPARAIDEMLRRLDPFRVRRVIFGHAALNGTLDKEGAAGLMRQRQEMPPPPEGMRETAPPIPALKDRPLRAKVKWADEEPVAARQQQDAWYRWRNRSLWAEVWSTQALRWARGLGVVEDGLRGLNQALSDLARQDPDRFRERSEYLYRPRVGVAFHLPAGNLEQFYQSVVTRLRDRLQLPAAATGADLLRHLIGEDGWREVYRQSLDTSPERAVNDLRQRVKTLVKTYLREETQGRPTLLPKLRDLLNQAAGLESDRPRFGDEEIDEFNGRLTGLVPANFTPQGNGPLRILVSYPGGKNGIVEDHLRTSLQLPSGPGVTVDFSNTTAESISVVLFRFGMGITDVQEVRHVLRTWAAAVHDPRPDDYLPWRQRTGFDFGYLATREEHRVRILHRLLCTIWNGDLRAEGDPASPTRVHVTLNEVTMTLDLRPLEDASSWGSLVQSYELWTLADNDAAERVFCGQLMRATPHGVGERAHPPSKLFELVVQLADDQIDRIDQMLGEINPASRDRARLLRGFWARTLPAAMRLPFDVPATREHLRGLYDAFRRGTGEGS